MALDKALTKKLQAIAPGMSPENQVRMKVLLEQYEKIDTQETAQGSLMGYAKAIWPDMIAGSHHVVMADAFDRIVNGESKRLIINLAPRMSKSKFASWLLPSYFLGKFPHKQLMQC